MGKEGDSSLLQTNQEKEIIKVRDVCCYVCELSITRSKTVLEVKKVRGGRHMLILYMMILLQDVTNKLAHYVARVKRIEDERNQMRGELESQSARLSSEIEGLEAALDKKEK